MKRTYQRQLSGNLVVTLYFVSKLVPMCISFIAIYLGYRLFVLGVTGQASLVVNANSLSGQLLNAAPGLFFSVGGIVALIISIWKGSTFTFSRSMPDESWAFCLPVDRIDRSWLSSESRKQMGMADELPYSVPKSRDTTNRVNNS
jgi:hypothetical protein